jgi:histidinol-phosphatase (PHP family)
MTIIDGHVHSPYCPHGTGAAMEEYVKVAERKGIDVLVFTEHAPLPEGFEDPVPEKDSAMSPEDVRAYLEEGARLRKEYAGRVDVCCGFEVDYIEGFEEETLRFLEEHREAATHSILSVHFVKAGGNWFCLDYSADAFAEKAEEVGVEHLYEAYGKAMEKAAEKPFGEMNPPVLGHINLIHKFRNRIRPESDPVNWTKILEKAVASGYVLDYNHAGLRKPDYREPYPEPWMLEKAERLGLKLQTGSDAHAPEDVGKGFV